MNRDFQDNSWENILKILIKNRKSKKNIFQMFTNEELRIRIQFVILYIIFAVVSAGMTIVNVFTNYSALGLSTFTFALVNVLNILLAMNSKTTESFSRKLFAFEILALFTFFIVNGNPEGFSVIWITLLPVGGMLLYRMRYGLIISLVQFAELVFFLWTDVGNSLLLYDYTDSFMLRFPFLYIAFLTVGVFFEFLRAATQNELIKTRNDFEYMSNHDILTGISNRLGFNKEINKMINSIGKDGVAFAIVDIDHFKRVNDTYGHLCGDEVLKSTAKIIEKTVGLRGKVSRWGGEEFAVIINSYEISEQVSQDVLDAIKAQEFHFGDSIYKITASLGLVKTYGEDKNNLSQIVNFADNNLYTAKETGRDRMIVSVI